MFITKAKKYHEQDDGTIVAYDYYRLTKSYRDSKGVSRKCSVFCLGTLDGFTKAERNELADMLTCMIENGQSVMHENRALYEKAMELYVKYRESKYALANDPVLKAETERKERERLRDMVTVKLSSLTQHEARSIGAEHLCNSTLRMLRIRGFLTAKGWSGEQTNLALMQIIACAIYPFSELKTVSYLRENTALTELFKIPKEKITKDALYKSAHRLWDVHRELEDWLHQGVCNMFNIEEKILLMDISNTYFEGKMADSKLCQYGRSKEKRRDCKIVVLAVVVNTEGLIVRSMIYEGNRHDSKTVKEVVGSLAKETSEQARKIIVMDAGFYSKENVKLLSSNGFDYITVLPSADGKFIPKSEDIIRHEDCRHQEIRLQMGKVLIDGEQKKALLVDSDGKATKERDAVNIRLGKLDQKYGAIRKNFTINFAYENKEKNQKVTSMTWIRNEMKSTEVRKFHGKYVLLTSLDEKDEVNIWKFYNVIRTVEETFHILKSDLDIRPVYHKSDDGIKAHLNLAFLAYWLVSVTKYRLKLKDYESVPWDEIIRIANASHGHPQSADAGW